MIDLTKFRENATAEGFCDEYVTKWDNCGSKKELVDMAFSVKAVDYLCDAIAKGWGLSPDYIADKFKAYINGNYTLDTGGYTSQMYCKYKGDIICDVALLTLIDCDATIELPEFQISQIYSTGKTNIRLYGKGEAIIVAYGNPDDVTVENIGDVRYKRKQKIEKD